jgi:hypothetical protein
MAEKTLGAKASRERERRRIRELTLVRQMNVPAMETRVRFY